MEILIDGFAAAACAGFLAITGHRSVGTPAQLIVAACVASVVMVVALVTGVCTFAVVVCMWFVNLIARVCMTFLVGVLGMLAKHVARLKILVLAHGGTLFVTRIGAASVAVATLNLLALTMISAAALHAVQPVGLAMVQKIAQLAGVALLKLSAHLALHTWVLSKDVLAWLKGFHIHAAYKMAKMHMPCRATHRQRIYPPSDMVLEECGMHTIQHYNDVQWETIAKYVIDRSIFVECE
jgi:hypothetical protein